MPRRQQQQHQQKHDTAASLCLMLLVTVIFLASACSASAKQHNHQHGSGGEGPLRWDLHHGGRRGRGKDGEGGGEPGAKHLQEDDNVISRPGGRSSTTDPSGPRRKVLLHEAVRKLLGFESSPGLRRRGRKGRGPKLLPDPWKPPPMPKYVLDLYNKYRSGEMMHSPDLGNTVRSIPAEIGVVNGEAMFIFNLSSVASTERVLRAHVHLYKRRKSSASRKRNRRRRGGKRLLRFDDDDGGGGGDDGDDGKGKLRRGVETELVLYEVAPHYLSQTGSIIMRSSSRGWQWYGATDAVLGCLTADREHPHLFALSFRAEKPNGKVRTLALKRFVRHHSMPFLILYSNETKSVNLEELDIVAERLMLKERRDSSSSSSSPSSSPNSVHHPRSHHYYGGGDDVYAKYPNYDYDENDDDFEEENEDADVEKEAGIFGEHDFDYYDYEDDNAENERTGKDDDSDDDDDVNEEGAVDWFKGFGRKKHRKKKLHKSSNHDKKFGHHHKKHDKHSKTSKTHNDKFLPEVVIEDSNKAESSDDAHSSSTENSDIITDSAVVTTVISTDNASSHEANKLRELSRQQNHGDSGESRDRDSGELDIESRGESPRHDDAESHRSDSSKSRENSQGSDQSQLSDDDESQYSDNNGDLPPLREEQGQDVTGAADSLLLQSLQTPAAERRRRHRRSILTNEIPEDVSAEEFPKNFHYRFSNLPQTHPGMLTSRNDLRRKNHHRGGSEASSSSRLIPYPAERHGSKSKSQRRRRKHRRRQNRLRRIRKNRRRRLPLPEEWENYHNLATPDNNPGQVCSRRRLVVDFADMGWGDWIISPKSFEAHYCAGTCPFPLTKKLRPSNHATIQSIVNAIGMYSDVPAPCCVPDTMTSVTLLYFDENRNVVLKNYPGMSVQSCACR